MRISTLAISAIIAISATFGMNTSAYAQSVTTSVKNEALLIESFNDYSFDTYLKAIGEVATDENRKEFDVKRNAFLSKGKTTPNVANNSKVNEALLIESFNNYSFDTYLKAIGEVATDENRKEFDVKRNAFLGIQTPKTIGVETTQAIPATTSAKPKPKPSTAYMGKYVSNKANRRTVTVKPGYRKVTVTTVVRTYEY